MTQLPRAPLASPARGRARRAAPLLLLAMGILLIAQPWLRPVHAGDKNTGRIDLEASLEPADLAPGQSGHVVVKATLLNQEHKVDHFVYAEGEKGIKVRAVEAPGVTYGLAKKAFSPTEDVKDFDEVHKAWKNEFTLRVPVTLGMDVKQGAKIGLEFDYYGCIVAHGCYAPVKKQQAVVVLGGGSGSALDGSKGGAAVDPKLAAEPTGSAVGVPDLNGGEASATWNAEKSEVIVTFSPEFLHHFYGPNHVGNEIPIAVVPVKAAGVEWGAVDYQDAPDKIEMAHPVRVPVKKADGVLKLELQVTFQSCTAGNCKNPVEGEVLSITWPGAAPRKTEPKVERPKGDVLFPVVEDDELRYGGQIAEEDDSGVVQELMNESPVLGLLFIMLTGVILAFTPCVLPIIPITVSVISGGDANIEKKRLTMLLVVYVAGLSLCFATLGTVAAAAGSGVSALFSLGWVQVSIALVFLALAFSMAGVYELQPPAWLMNLQGGAQKRSGSMIGAFMFGVLGAIIASPCTAPVVAGMLIITAQWGSLGWGFAMFFALGLGMGAVFFAAGSLNFLMRPGPWMVWVRYAFAVMLFGMAMYYLHGKGVIGVGTMWVLGLAVCAALAYGIFWHLTTKEGEDKPRALRRGLQVAALCVLCLPLVAWMSETVTGEWEYVKDTAHLEKLVAEAKAEGKPVVVDFWAKWCATCVEYDELIETTPELKKNFDRLRKLKVDVGNDDIDHLALRDALGMVSRDQPYMVFIDKKGRIRRGADVTGWYSSDGVMKLKARLALVLGQETVDGQPMKPAGDDGKKKVETGDTK